LWEKLFCEKARANKKFATMEGCTIVLSDCHISSEEEEVVDDAEHRALWWWRRSYGRGGSALCNLCDDDDA